jgi:hypothetical protein
MKKLLLVVGLIVAALAAAGNVGFKLADALRQVEAITSTKSVTRDGPPVEAARRMALPETAAVVVPTPPRAEPLHAGRRPVAEPPALEPAGLPGSDFNSETAIHAAAERDPAIAELLSDPDPAVGAAIRDFINNIEPPRASTAER